MFEAKNREELREMPRRFQLLPFLFTATAAALILAVAAPQCRADDLELETLKFFIEFNETDEDIGVQCVLGGEPYVNLKAYDPDGHRVLELKPKGVLRDQAMSDLFFESAEPELAELSIEEFLERWPEGEYEFETITEDGEDQDGDAEFTHMIPAGPVITYPTDGLVVPAGSVVVTWNAVTMTTAYNPPQVPVNIVGYQVIVTREDPLRILSMDVPAGATAATIPGQWLEADTEYELEVIAIEESDNQTISLLFFQTPP